MKFEKYHALGNDYLVLDPVNSTELPSPRAIETICHRNFGLGSDGILYGPLPSQTAFCRLRILNPDASEAEKSGNGLRIFARYLYDHGRVSENDPFTVETLGGLVSCRVARKGAEIAVDMGTVSFLSPDIPVLGEPREVVNEPFTFAPGHSFNAVCVTVGNPHCVIPVTRATPEQARQLGPLVENHAGFPNRINMQLLEIIDRRHIRIEIWERGAGYTLASGSSSCAAAAAARKLGQIGDDVTVLMPGGNLQITFLPSGQLRMTGPASPIASMVISPNLLSD